MHCLKLQVCEKEWLRHLVRARSDDMANKKLPVVLCVDDDESLLRIVELTLRFQGYEVVTATNGRAALDKFSDATIDAVVLDYDMPGMNGIQLAREMKRLKPLVPKVLFTSHSALPKQDAEAIEGFCSKGDGTRPLLLRLQDLLTTAAHAPSAAAS